MRIKIEELINKHKNTPCVVALHGPSLNKDKEEIKQFQNNKGMRISVNEWYDYFSEKPDYWVVSNSEFTVSNSMLPNYIWDVYRKWPKDIFNKFNIPLLYNCTADLTDSAFVDENLKCDYYPFDSRHFMQKKCSDILRSFKAHYEENKNFDFKKYGNNSVMWQPRSVKGTSCSRAYAAFGGGWSRDNSCCHKIKENNFTLQEILKTHTGHEKHLGPGTNGGTFAIAFAILMGCNPIYVSGLDLDYSLGYASALPEGQKQTPNPMSIGHWKHVYRKTIINDLTILKESAALVGIELINLNYDSWHKVLNCGNILK
jgi:hypothetical protein